MARVPSLVTTGVTYTASLSWEKKKIMHSQNTWASSILKARVLWTVPRCSTSRCFKPSRSLWREKLQRQSSSTTAKLTSRWTPRRSFYNLQCPGLSPPGNPLEGALIMLKGSLVHRRAGPEAASAGYWGLEVYKWVDGREQWPSLAQDKRRSLDCIFSSNYCDFRQEVKWPGHVWRKASSVQINAQLPIECSKFRRNYSSSMNRKPTLNQPTENPLLIDF